MAHAQVLGEVIKAGATTINIPDTTGWNLPHEYSRLIEGIIANTPGAKDVSGWECLQHPGVRAVSEPY